MRNEFYISLRVFQSLQTYESIRLFECLMTQNISQKSLEIKSRFSRVLIMKIELKGFQGFQLICRFEWITSIIVWIIGKEFNWKCNRLILSTDQTRW